MTIAMVLSGDKELIVPIVEGDVIRLYDLETEDVNDCENPVSQLQSGKRGAMIRWLNEREVNILVAPPSMLCELSYEAAQKEHFRYYRVPQGTSFSDFKRFVSDNNVVLTRELPESEIEPSIVPAPSK